DQSLLLIVGNRELACSVESNSIVRLEAFGCYYRHIVGRSYFKTVAVPDVLEYCRRERNYLMVESRRQRDIKQPLWCRGADPARAACRSAANKDRHKDSYKYRHPHSGPPNGQGAETTSTQDVWSRASPTTSIP